MERTWDVIRRYGTQSIMKVELNQPIMREVLEKVVNSVKSDDLTESVTEDSDDDQQITRKLPVRRAKKGLKRLKGKTGGRAVNQKVNQRWCDACRGRKREPDTPYVIGRFDNNGHEVKENCMDSGGY